MEKQKILKILILPILLLTISIFFTGCSEILKTDNTPLIFLNDESNEVLWEIQPNATKYEVSVNNENFHFEKTSIETQSISSKTYSSLSLNNFDLETGVYELQVRAVFNGFKSNLSNSVWFCVGENFKTFSNAITTQNSELLGANDIYQSGSILKWKDNFYAKSYVILTFSNEFGFQNFETKNSFIDLKSICSNSTPSAIKVGCKYNGKDIVYLGNDHTFFYNPDNDSKFTSNLYLFNGQLNDYLIKNESELANVLYYNFVSRTPNYSIRLTKEFAEQLKNGSSNEFAIESAITQIFSDNILETSVYALYVASDENAYVCSKSKTGEFDYDINIFFYNIEECSLSIFHTFPVQQTTQEQSVAPYYEIYDFSNKRNSEYNSFASDSKFFKVNVSTSEELYWAVENGYVPIPEKNSRAELIYEKAKSILREIISDDMSEYEKALSIFDYICSTTTYDSTDLSMLSIGGVLITQLPSFYLEGVFLKNIAVCDGYAKAFSLLCNMEGINCIRITGDINTFSNPERHAWNKVQVDGEWYFADLTWADLTHGKSERLSHRYFLITDEQTQYSHIPSSSTSFNPPTSATPLDYYSNTFITKKLKSKTINEDLVINSDNELKNIIEYCTINKITHIELFFTREYIKYKSNLNGYIGNFISHAHFSTAFSNMDLDFESINYYLSNSDYYLTPSLRGCVVIFNIRTLLNNSNILEFSNYIIKERVNKEYICYLPKTYLDSIYTSTTNYQIKIKNLENNIQINGFNISLTLTDNKIHYQSGSITLPAYEVIFKIN